MGRNGPIKKRKMRKILVFIATAMLLSACGPAKPTAEQIAAADYGSVPKDPQQTVMEYMKMVLPDSESAQYGKWSYLSRYWYRDYGGAVPFNYGYMGCVDINAKNRFGVYDGFKAYKYVIRNDQVVLYNVGKSAEHMMRALTLDPVTKECLEVYKTNGIYGGRPTPAQLAVADYGSVPKNPQQTVMEHMKTLLSHPENARYDKWSNLRKTQFLTYYGYMGCVYIDAKSKEGDYTGFRLALYVINNDKVVKTMGDNESGSENERILKLYCDPLYQTNTDAEVVKINASSGPVTLRQQVNPPAQLVNPKPLPIRVGE